MRRFLFFEVSCVSIQLAGSCLVLFHYFGFLLEEKRLQKYHEGKEVILKPSKDPKLSIFSSH